MVRRDERDICLKTRTSSFKSSSTSSGATVFVSSRTLLLPGSPLGFSGNPAAAAAAAPSPFCCCCCSVVAAGGTAGVGEDAAATDVAAVGG